MSGQPAELYITFVILGVRRCYSMWLLQSQLISWSAGRAFILCLVSPLLLLLYVAAPEPQKSAGQLVSWSHF